MKVTYEDLKKEYILNVGDSLEINGWKYQVDINNGYYLLGLNCSNEQIFISLGKNDIRHSWARKFGNMVGTDTCNFPELSTLSELTQFVKDIYKTVCHFKESQSPSSKSKSIQITPSLPSRTKVLTHIKL